MQRLIDGGKRFLPEVFPTKKSDSHPLAEGRLTVHGWYYHILSGRIGVYDERQQRFLLLAG